MVSFFGGFGKDFLVVLKGFGGCFICSGGWGLVGWMCLVKMGV